MKNKNGAEFKGGQIVVLTDAIGRGGKRYMLVREGGDLFALRDEAGSCKTKRYSRDTLANMLERGLLTMEDHL